MNSRGPRPRNLVAQALVLLLLSARAYGTCSDNEFTNRADPPNIILVIADDLGWQDLPYFSPPIRWKDNQPNPSPPYSTALEDAYKSMRRDENRLAARMMAQSPCEVEPCTCSTTHSLGTFVRTYPAGPSGTTTTTAYPVIPKDTTANPPAAHTYECTVAPEVAPLPPPAPPPSYPAVERQILSHFGGFQKLRSQGVVFPRFYSPSALCVPSRTGILTGRGGPRTGKTSNRAGIKFEATIAEYLQQGCPAPPGSDCSPTAEDNLRVNCPLCFGTKTNGVCKLAGTIEPRCFKTGIIGKWHLGLPRRNRYAFDRGQSPISQGFEEALVFSGQDGSYTSPDFHCSRERLYVGDGVGQLDADCTPDQSNNDPANCCRGSKYRPPGRTKLKYPACDVSGPFDCNYSIRLYTHLAMNFIHRHRNDPFFLVVTLNAIHNGGAQAPAWTEQHYPNADPGPGHWAAIEEIDASLGQLLTKLKSTHRDSDAPQMTLADRTIVFFTSDHGGVQVNYGEPRLRGKKATVYEGGVRVGLYANACNSSGGVVNNDVISGVDFLPTIAEAVGLPLTLVGHNLRTCDDDLSSCGATPEECQSPSVCTDHHVDGLSFYKRLLPNPQNPPPPRKFVYAKVAGEMAVASRTIPPGDPETWLAPGGTGVCGFAGENADHLPVRYASCKRCNNNNDCTAVQGCVSASEAQDQNCTGAPGEPCDCPVCLPSAWKLRTAEDPASPSLHDKDSLYDLGTNPEERDGDGENEHLQCLDQQNPNRRDEDVGFYLKRRAYNWNNCKDEDATRCDLVME